MHRLIRPPLNYGLPSIVFSSNFAGMNEQQPESLSHRRFRFSETFSWIHGKHNFRFGGDYRRVHDDFLSGSNATGTFAFTGLFTQNDGRDPNTVSRSRIFCWDFRSRLLSTPRSTRPTCATT